MSISLLFGVLLLATAGGSYSYINMQKAQISQLKIEIQTAISNQVVLENTIKQQNVQMQDQLETQKQNQIHIADLSEAHNEARQEITKLRNTFARHDLNSLAIAKPGLIEKIVNRGTKRVNEALTVLTDPGQFDEVVSAD